MFGIFCPRQERLKNQKFKAAGSDSRATLSVLVTSPAIAIGPEYNAAAPPQPHFQHALANVVERATERATDGQRIFSPVAALWDEYTKSEAVPALPQRLHQPLIRLYKEVSILATRHFNAYIKGSSPPRITDIPPANQNPNIASPLTTALAPALAHTTLPQPRMYAQAAIKPSSS